LLNALSVSGYIAELPKWIPKNEEHNSILKIQYSYSKIIWPWSGFFAVEISVAEKVSQEIRVEGTIQFTVVADGSNLTSQVEIPVKLKVVPTPPRDARILWDQFHQLRYPSGFFPKDNLDVRLIFFWLS
jgi:membrane-bound transcription factor site-1 protease